MRVGHANSRSLPASPTGSRSSVAPNPCVDAADACTADERYHRLRTAYVVQCLGHAAPGVPPRPLPPRPAPLLRPRAASACTHCFSALAAARVRRAPAPDLRALLRFLRAWPGATFLPQALDACEHSRICRCRRRWKTGWGWGRAGVRPLEAHSPPSGRAAQAPASWPSRSPARPQPATLTAASKTRPQAACAPTPASWSMHRPEDLRGCLRLDGPITLFSGLTRHSHHAQLRGQRRKRARGALMRLLQSQRKSA